MVFSSQLPQKQFVVEPYPINHKNAIIGSQQQMHNTVRAAIGDLRRVVSAISVKYWSESVAPGDYGYMHEKAKLESCMSHLTEARANTKKSSPEWSQLNATVKMVRQASHYHIRLDECTAALTSLCSFERQTFPPSK